MASFYKKSGKWGVWIRRSFHKPIKKKDYFKIVIVYHKLFS